MAVSAGEDLSVCMLGMPFQREAGRRMWKSGLVEARDGCVWALMFSVAGTALKVGSISFEGTMYTVGICDLSLDV